MTDTGFLETLLEYYLPGLDVSLLTDEQMAAKLGWLFKIRQMEREDQAVNVMNNLFGSK
jgi:hypothetical protein